MRGLGCWIVALSIQLHGMPAAAAPEPCRPWVRTVDGQVQVGAKRCSSDALVIVWRPYELSAETFWAPAGAYTARATLHHGRVRVWLRFTDGTEQTYRKRMHSSS